MNENWLTIEEVARTVGVPYYRIAYAHRAGKLPEPPRLGGRRVYDAETVEAVRGFFVEEAARAVDRLSGIKNMKGDEA